MKRVNSLQLAAISTSTQVNLSTLYTLHSTLYTKILLLLTFMQRERKDKNFIKKPIFQGGPKAMRKFITEHLQYPADALQNKIEGTVSLKYTIDHFGHVIDTHIIAGLGYGCDEEAARLVRLFKFDVPKTRGVKVQFHNNIHIHFRLPKKKQPAPKKLTAQYVYTTPAEKPTASGYHYTLTITPAVKKDK